MKTKINIFLFEIILIVLLLILGFYLSLISGYGSDEDTLPLIGAFESILGGDKLMASRFTPYPVAELGIGFLSYQFGSWAANLITFIFIVIGLFFFYFGIDKKSNNRTLLFFLLLSLTNPVIFFDNLEPIDYSWAFLPLAIGLFFFKKKYFDLAIIFFGISIGARIYFFLFVLAIILLFKNKNEISYNRKYIIFLGSFFIGGLFYLPFWFENGMSLHWLTAATPSDQGLFGLIARFSYKLIMSFSVLTALGLLMIFFILKKKNLKFNFPNFINGIIIVNLIIFFIIPAELSYLQPLIISVYFLCSINLSKKLIYILILLNLTSWFVEIKPLSVQYKSNDICKNVEAIDAKIDFSLTKGRFYEYLNSRDKIKCWVKDESDRSKKILAGKALK